MQSFDELKDIVARLRAEDGCPWDRAQTHATLKAPCIEEAAEVVCGINVLQETGNPENLREELGDLLFQVILHAQLAEEEGLFTLDDVIREISEKMIRRHPHVFGSADISGVEDIILNWEEIKKEEKKGKADASEHLPAAFEEARSLIDAAARRKGFTIK